MNQNFWMFGDDPVGADDIDNWDGLEDYCDDNVNMEFDDSTIDSIESGGFVKTELINSAADEGNAGGKRRR